MASRSKAPPGSRGKQGSSEAEIAARQRALYAQPLDQFTRARDALAKELAAEGHTQEAQAIKKLKRPVVPAWIVNRLAQGQPEHMDQFLSSAHALELAHRRAMSGLAADQLKDANRAFQQSLEVLMKDVNASLSELGRDATGDLIRQVEETLRAAALGTAEERTILVRGTLTQPLRSSGFGSLSPLMLVGPAPERPAPKPPKPPPNHRPEKAPKRPAPTPHRADAKVLRGPWAPQEEAQIPVRTMPKPHAAPAQSPAQKRKAREEAEAEARHQRDAELRQLRREAKQSTDEATLAEKNARHNLVRTQAALRTLKAQTLQARRVLETAETKVHRAREALEAAEELARQAREELQNAEEAERAQAEEAERADEQAAVAERALTQARRHLEQTESRLHR